MRIDQDSWYITQRVIRRYPKNKKLMRDSEGVFRERIIREIEAVEEALETMLPEHRQIIVRRFWSNKGRSVQYECMQDSGYSIRQMKRIVEKMTRKTAEKLGEIAMEKPTGM